MGHGSLHTDSYAFQQGVIHHTCGVALALFSFAHSSLWEKAEQMVRSETYWSIRKCGCIPPAQTWKVFL